MNHGPDISAPGLGAPQGGEFSDTAWNEVLQAVDRTYVELVAYQEQLEAKNAELDALRRFMGSVLNSVSDVLIVLGRDGRIEHSSLSLRDMVGADEQSLLGQPLDALISQDTRPALQAAVRAVIEGRAPRHCEADLITPSGPAPLEISLAPRLDERSKNKGVVLTGRPVGELRRAYSELAASHAALQAAQAQLVRNEKLASLGRLLAGVAHELNNPISFVYANAHALEKYATRFEQYFEAVQSGASRADLVHLREELRLDRELKNLRTAIDGARDGAERVRDIVADLRRLSAEGTGDMAPLDLAEITHVAANWVMRGTKTPVKVRFEGAERLPAVGRAGHIQQIVMNLVQNALDAVADTEAPEVIITLGQEAGRAFVTVRDNGPGIDPEKGAAIFDPFFTTKPVGQGTGLGLSISHKIAEEHGGDLRLCSFEGSGACFRFELPAPAPEDAP